MPVVPTQEILADAFARRYGVGAFNIVNDLTMRAVLAAAAETQSPVIVQVSVRTACQMGPSLIQLMFAEMARRLPVPASLQLDHCPDRKIIAECINAGWNAVLFDDSQLSYEQNLSETAEVVAMAHRHGVAVEGELEAVKGVEDGVGSEKNGALVPLDKVLAFLRATGIDSFAPAIGTAHGLYKREPKINFQRVSDIVQAQPLPLVVHGGTGLSGVVFQELIRRGAVKVNISTQLKITFLNSLRTYLNNDNGHAEPSKLFAMAGKEVQEMASAFMRVFGSAGRAA